jgi:hypothetical protein
MGTQMNEYRNTTCLGRFCKFGSTTEFWLHAIIYDTGEVDGFFYTKSSSSEPKSDRIYLTFDDATMLHHDAYSLYTDVKLEDIVDKALKAQYVFEAGYYFLYEGNSHVELFANFNAAKAYADTLEHGQYDPQPYVLPRMIN